MCASTVSVYMCAGLRLLHSQPFKSQKKVQTLLNQLYEDLDTQFDVGKDEVRRIAVVWGTQWGGVGTQWGGVGTQWGGVGTQWGGAGTQWGGVGTRRGGAGTQWGGAGTRRGGVFIASLMATCC